MRSAPTQLGQMPHPDLRNQVVHHDKVTQQLQMKTDLGDQIMATNRRIPQCRIIQIGLSRYQLLLPQRYFELFLGINEHHLIVSAKFTIGTTQQGIRTANLQRTDHPAHSYILNFLTLLLKLCTKVNSYNLCLMGLSR